MNGNELNPTRFDTIYTARLAILAASPIPPIAAFFAGNSVLPILVASGIFAGMTVVSRGLDHTARAVLMSIAVIGLCILFTASLTGHPWQIDTHMAFFAALAIISTTGSITALLVGVALTAVHHLSFGLLLPYLVYPSTELIEILGRTALHAFIVVFEAAILALSMMRSQKANQEIQAAQAEMARSADEATQARARAEKAGERAIAVAQRTREHGRQAAVAVEQISVAAKAAATYASESQKVVAQAKEDASKSAEIVGRTKGAMSSIRESSDQIGQIVEMIDEIARRTDLLALNAAVESARAGDAGRGFAVVANEVRKLAQQSADATTRIRSLVATSTGRVREGADLVVQAELALHRISDAVAGLDSTIRDISAGAAEQSSGLEQVNQAIRRIDEISVEDSQNDDGGEDDLFAAPLTFARAQLIEEDRAIAA